MSRRNLIPGCLIIFMLLNSLVSCKTTSRDEKYYEKQEDKMRKMEQKEYDKKVKELRKLQSPSTLKMMRETERQARKFNKSR